MHATHRQYPPAGQYLPAGSAPAGSAPAVPGPQHPAQHQFRTDRADADRLREQAVRLVADAVCAGLPLPSRLHAEPGADEIVIGATGRAAWDLWRRHLGCSEIAVRVHETRGGIRRSTVARAVWQGCRVAVHLGEDIDPVAIRASVSGPGGCP